jgi:hypothetical protein
MGLHGRLRMWPFLPVTVSQAIILNATSPCGRLITSGAMSSDVVRSGGSNRSTSQLGPLPCGRRNYAKSTRRHCVGDGQSC